ncbi:hypothetical protein VTO73DRAFT_9360 [Trametes versicolor]
MKDRRLGVLLLQEAHLTDERCANIHRMFANRIKVMFSSHPTAPTQREGVAVILNKKIISAKGAEMKVIVPGRAIQLELPWRGGEVRRILCMYAPTSAGVGERTDFFKEVKRYYETHPHTLKPHLMAGDFNNVEDAMDRAPMSEGGVDASVEALDDLKRSLGLEMVDGWRATYPTARCFTFHRGTGEAATMSRLDRIYVTPEVGRWTREWGIEQVGVKTDHSLVSVLLTTLTAPEVGKGRPVFPMHLLRDKELAKKMKERGKVAERELMEVKRVGRTNEANPQTVLSSLKEDWLQMSRDRERDIVPRLIREIDQLEKKLAEHERSPERADAVREEVAELCKQLKALKAKRCKQQQEKTRAKHRVAGEIPTKYWTRLHVEPAPRELIPAFEIEDRRDAAGERCYETDSAKMADMAKTHYDGIQKDGPEIPSPERREADIRIALESVKRPVSDEDREELAAVIQREECELALQTAKSGTAPGLDGIQYEVWKTMHARFVEDSRHPTRTGGAFDVLAILTAAFEDIQKHGVCEGTGFADGWMSPIYKEKGERTRVVNYRPITLLNTDYKLLTKILAVRLAAVAPAIIHPAQAGFVPGRRLRNHTQLAKMMMAWAEAKEENGMIVALDQEKAYDRIAHDYLWRVLEKFRIPEQFTAIIKTLYANAVTSVAVNGVTSNTYRIYRGVRQGDPLSCLLFDLAIEPLSEMIRGSPLEGYKIPGALETLKATLFADDTTVYLKEGDDFGKLQEILDTWCSAAKAKFNIAKTELIPIGSKSYRAQVVETHKREGRWKNFPEGAQVAADGRAVRMLGAMVGNGVDDGEAWTVRLAKVESAMKRWRQSSSTNEGKVNAAQMLVGSMTQFATDVQRMPETVVKRLVAMIRCYVWEDKHHVPVAMEYLYLPKAQGGLDMIDIEARNEAIDIMWLKAYLSSGPGRPMWAAVVDDLLAHHVPKDTAARKELPRINMFLQHWSPKTCALPADMKAMIKVAKKYGLRQEGLAFNRATLRDMPIWGHGQTDVTEMKKMTRKSAAVRCLARNHGVVTVGDAERLAGNLSGAEHRTTQKCVCAACELAITVAGCSNPHRCFMKAKGLMDLLPTKWDPRGTHPEDYEEADMETAENIDPDAVPFDRRISTKGGMSQTFRIFTDEKPVCNRRLVTKIEANGGTLTVATDGSCIKNGYANAKAGAGVFFGESDPRNVAVRVPEKFEQTNQVAETVATLMATKEAAQGAALIQITDSKSVMNALTSDRKHQEDTGYILNANGAAIRAATAALRARRTHTYFKWVKGHSGHPGNEAADKLAAEGVGKEEGGEVSLDIEQEWNVSGAKLAAMTQKIAYRAIRDRKQLNSRPRRRTAANVGEIIGDLKEKFPVEDST